MSNLFGPLIVLSIILGAVFPVVAGEDSTGLHQDSFTDPLNGTYGLEGMAIRLHDGRFEMVAAVGSATQIWTAVYGSILHGDLDDDGDEDVALMLSHDPGGSGMFFYVAVAINRNGHYQGTNAVFLGDRVLPLTLTIRDGLLVVGYADRRLGEAMTTPPSVPALRHMMLTNHTLVKLDPLGEEEQVMAGWVTIGHEVRVFQPCEQKKVLWLQGDSPALSRIMSAYRQTSSNSRPYRPVLMILRGQLADPPADGFGRDYAGAFVAGEILRVSPDGHCADKQSLEYASTAHEGREPTIETDRKISLDLSSLDQEGLYGLTDGKRALSYEFCIPGSEAYRLEVARIDPTLRCTAGSPGRIGCRPGTYLCLGPTHQKDFIEVLRHLAELPYVVRIDQAVFE